MIFQKCWAKAEGEGGGRRKVEGGEGEEGRKKEKDKKGEWKGQQGIGQCKLLSIVRNGASAC